jgi:hypothetical protein
MTDAVLKAALDEAQGKPGEGGFVELPEGRRITLHAAHAGVPLTVTKIEKIARAAGVIRARNERGELFVLAEDDVFAVSVEGNRAGATGAPRKAGFLG